MDKKFRYGTVTDAYKALRKAGFSKDFSVSDNFIVCGTERFRAEEVRIAVVYRYEGESDPADEATVYGLESRTGLKGVLVVADGIYSDTRDTAVLKKLHFKQHKAMKEPAFSLT